MITREADYALRVVLCLADIPKGQSFSTAALAEQMNIPYRFLRRILRKLCISGVVGSVRGKDGGVYLLEKPAKVSVYDVLAVFDPKSLLLNRCHEDGNSCQRKKKCSVHITMEPVQKLLNKQLKSINFENLARK